MYVRLPLSAEMRRRLDHRQAQTAGGDMPPLDLDLQLPQCCVYCRKPLAGHLMQDVVIDGDSARLAVPYCREHLQQARRINATINNPWRMSYLLTALYIVAVALLYSQSKNADLMAVVVIGVLAAALGFPALTIWVLKPLLGLFYKPVRHTPTGGSLGLSIRYLRRERMLSLVFHNDAYAQAFIEANHP